MKRQQTTTRSLKKQTLISFRQFFYHTLAVVFSLIGFAVAEIRETESNNFFQHADTLNPGMPIHAAFSRSDLADFFILNLQATNMYQCNSFCDWSKYDLSALQADVFSASDTTHSVLYGNPSGRYGKFGFRLAGWQPPHSGWYYLVLRYPSTNFPADSIHYQVRLTTGTPIAVAAVQHETDDTYREAQNRAPVPTDGTRIHGYLYKKSLLYNWNDLDLYPFTGEKGFSLIAETLTAATLTNEPWYIRDADTEIALLDQNGKEIISNDDKETTSTDPWETTVGFNNTFSRIQVESLPYTGTYFIRVNSYYNSILRNENPEKSDTNPGGGEYLLSVQLTKLPIAVVHFEILNQANGLPLPGKMTAVGVEGTPSQGYYKFLHTAAKPGSLSLPPGAYTLAFTHGPEYTMVEQSIVLADGDTIHADARLQHVVDTEGYVCGDMHLHALEGITEEDKFGIMLTGLIGEGIEYAVATDHNTISNYQPRLAEMGLEHYIKTSPGDEISTSHLGHINAWPLNTATSAVISSGTAAEIFKDARQKGAAIIQINHPRWPGIDYFTKTNLDPVTAIFNHPFASEEFDAMELMNETNGWGFKLDPPNTPISVLEDWFHLLNRGKRYCAVGNSDAHGLNGDKPGYPRNYIASSTDKASEIDEAELIRSIRTSRVTVCNGHFTTFTINDVAHIGDQITDVDGTIKLAIRVQALSQISVDSVLVYGNGLRVAAFGVPAVQTVDRFVKQIELHPTQDTWYMVVSKGNTDIPIGLVQDNSGPIKPTGFTNPIWVDTDGDGIFMACNTWTDVAAKETSNPEVFSLEQNYPNPFNPSTTIAFNLGHTQWVKIIIFDITGKEVAKLVDEQRSAGSHKIVWNASQVANGLYFIKLEAGAFQRTIKAVLMK